MQLEPIGIFHTESKYPYEARRQATEDAQNSLGEVHLHSHRGFEQALEDLQGFERIWLIYQFHQNPDWNPKVMPPRGPRVKRGVFATRAPYRPNALGMSCVRLVKVDGLRVIVEGHDLLDGTPILDIKPYLPYADSFPDAKIGWLEEVEGERWTIEFSREAEQQIQWLVNEGVTQLRGFIEGQLAFDPLDHKRKRVERHENGYRLAYRTWRVDFRALTEMKKIFIESICSGYSADDLRASEDTYSDKSIHRKFCEHTFS